MLLKFKEFNVRISQKDSNTCSNCDVYVTSISKRFLVKKKLIKTIHWTRKEYITPCGVQSRKMGKSKKKKKKENVKLDRTKKTLISAST